MPETDTSLFFNKYATADGSIVIAVGLKTSDCGVVVLIPEEDFFSDIANLQARESVPLPPGELTE